MLFYVQLFYEDAPRTILDDICGSPPRRFSRQYSDERAVPYNNLGGLKTVCGLHTVS